MAAVCLPVLSERPPRRHLRSLSALAVQREGLTGWESWSKNQDTKVVYGVFTSPLPKYAKQMAAVEDTWAKDVPPQKLLVVGVNGSTPGITYKQAPLCKDGHVSNSGISCKEATLLTTGYELGADWVVVLGSDNYVFPKHIDARLAKEDANEPQIFGVFGCGDGKYCEDNKGGICGGAGYAISRGALDKMVGKAEKASETFVQESMETARTVSGYWSDQVTSCIARRRGVKEVELANLYGWPLCEAGATECSSFSEAAYRDKIMSSKQKPLTFHYITPKDMHKIHEMAHEQDSEAGVALFDSEGNTQTHKRARGRGKKHKHRGRGLSKKHKRRGRARAAGASIEDEVSLSLLAVVEDTYEVQRAEYVRKMDKEIYCFNASAAASY